MTRRRFKYGDRVRIADCSGIDSNKLALVSDYAHVADAYTRDLVIRKQWIPVLVDGQEEATAMPQDRLLRVRKQSMGVYIWKAELGIKDKD